VTIALLGADPAEGQVGVIITSSSPAVASRCARILPGVGAATSQNVTDPRLGPQLLSELAARRDVEQALHAVRSGTDVADYRQLTLIDMTGTAAAWSGPGSLGLHGESHGRSCVAAGNLLDNDGVLAAATETFEDARGSLTHRLITGLTAAIASGGEAGPVRSAGILIGGAVPWPIVDLRVDDHDDPLTELARLWSVYEPLVDDYVTRALDPAGAPAFGVPGDPGEETP
jgi:uncharacterized Ntn-hydrolase superfamily protein